MSWSCVGLLENFCFIKNCRHGINTKKKKKKKKKDMISANIFGYHDQFHILKSLKGAVGKNSDSKVF